MLCLRELIFAGQADARVQEANFTGCAKADTVVFMQKGGVGISYTHTHTPDFDDMRYVRDMRRTTVSDIANSCEQERIAVAA